MITEQSPCIKIINGIANLHDKGLSPENIQKGSADLIINTIPQINNVLVYNIEAWNAELLYYNGPVVRGSESELLKLSYPIGMVWKTVASNGLYCSSCDGEVQNDIILRRCDAESFISFTVKTDENSLMVHVYTLSGNNTISAYDPEFFKLIARQLQLACRSSGYRVKLIHTKEKLRTALGKLKKKETYENIISTITTTIHSSLNLQTVTESSADLIMDHIEAVDGLSIHIIYGDRAVLHTYRGYPDWFVERISEISYPSGTTWKTIIEGKARYIPDTEKDEVLGPAGKKLGIMSYLSIPLYYNENAIGVIHIISHSKNAFDSDELGLMSIVSKEIGIAIRNASQAESLSRSSQILSEKVEELSRITRHEEIINRVISAVHSSLDLDEVTRIAADSVMNNIDNVDWFAIYLVDQVNAVLHTYRGYPEWFTDRAGIIPYPRGFTWRTIIEGSSFYVPDTSVDEVIGSAGKQLGIMSYYSVPIKAGNNSIGCIHLISSKKDAFDLHDIYLMDNISKQIATAIIHAKNTEMLLQSEKNYQTLAEISPVGIYRTDSHGMCTYVNRRWQEIWGLNYEEACESSWAKYIHKEDHERVVNSWNNMIEKGHDYQEEYRIKRNDSQELWVLEQASPERDINNKITGYVGTVTDITDNKKSQEQLLQVQRIESMGNLAGGIAHNLNNMLQPIMMSIQTLKQRISDEKSLDLVNIVERSASHSADLVNRMLSLNRKYRRESELVSVNFLLEDVGNLLKDTFPSSVKTRFDIPDGIRNLRGDYHQLFQVIINLCINAKDAMPSGGTISVKAENSIRNTPKADGLSSGDEYVTIYVSDNGTGISKDNINHIFDPFFTTKDPGKGTGLGLSTSYRIISEHGGRIEVTSEVGKGTTFTLYLPATSGKSESR